jgi:hypothetical protein
MAEPNRQPKHNEVPVTAEPGIHRGVLLAREPRRPPRASECSRLRAFTLRSAQDPNGVSQRQLPAGLEAVTKGPPLGMR